jgi:N-acetyl-anhydromuramyl-L-alanine amidase AmpD
MNPREPSAHPRIIICGEEIEVPGEVPVVTFRDDPSVSFMAARRRHPEFRYLYPRVDPDGGYISKVDDLKKVVKRVVLHTDVTKTAADCFSVLEQEGYSTHFIIDWDGTIVQCADPQYTAIHAGPANRSSIGIDMNNVLPNLAAKGFSSVTYPALNPGIHDPDSAYYRPKTELKIINGIRTQSYGYCDKQYEGLLALLKALLKVIPSINPYPPVNDAGKVVLNTLEDFGSHEGIMAHWHISVTRWDPGPGFDWDRMVAGLAEEHNSFPLLIGDRKNIAKLMSRKKVEQKAAEYYYNNESGLGGYYPMGLHQNWHGGVHLHAPEGAEVLAMMDGYVVAVHFAQEATSLGSNNFVLLRHDFELPGMSSQGTPTRKELKLYSLYMHLDPMDMEPDRGSPPWLKTLYRFNEGERPEEEDELEGAERDDDDDDDDDLETDLEKTVKGHFPYLEVGTAGLAGAKLALKSGQIALFPTDEDSRVRVTSNERLGRVGTFGEDLEREPLLHVEVFGDDSWRDGIDMNKHGDFWVELEEDLANDLVVDNEEILRMVVSSHKRLKRRGEGEIVARPNEIEDFFSDSEAGGRRYLRRAIVRHISEWSDRVDWVQSLSKGQGWDTLMESVREWVDDEGRFARGFFIDEIQRFLPFVWLNERVSDHIGLQAGNGVLYYFHPIYFLMWLTFRSAQRIQVLSSGLSAEQLKRAYRDEMKRYEEQRERRIRDENAENIAEGCIAWDLDTMEASPDEVFEDLKRIRFPNQWKVDDEDS